MKFLPDVFRWAGAMLLISAFESVGSERVVLAMISLFIFLNAASIQREIEEQREERKGAK